MNLQLHSTSKVVELNGLPARIWEGVTDSGIKVHCFINRVAVDKDEDQSVHDQFKKEIQECKPPSKEVESYPLRMII